MRLLLDLLGLVVFLAASLVEVQEVGANHAGPQVSRPVSTCEERRMREAWPF